MEKQELEKLAIEVFGDASYAATWWKKPALALGGVKPVDADQDMVELLLERLRYCVYV